MRFTIFFMLGLAFFSCSKEYNYSVDDELRQYFDLFETEGNSRGWNIDLEAMSVSGYIETIDERNTVGQCQTSDMGNKRVVIDGTFWNRYDFYEREFIVFHELGHCILGRDHDDSADSANRCKSIMSSGSGGCINNYSEKTRTDYLDELFDN